jgi:hypothetical protein
MVLSRWEGTMGSTPPLETNLHARPVENLRKPPARRRTPELQALGVELLLADYLAVELMHTSC